MLGDSLEANFRRALILSDGNYMTFFNSWISITFLTLAALLFVVVLMPAIRKTRDEALQEDPA